MQLKVLHAFQAYLFELVYKRENRSIFEHQVAFALFVVSFRFRSPEYSVENVASENEQKVMRTNAYACKLNEAKNEIHIVK